MILSSHETIARVLPNIPDGVCVQTHQQTVHAQAPFLFEQISAHTSGKGCIKNIAVFPGIEASYLCFLSESAHFQHVPLANVLEIFYCIQGRVGWNLDDGTALYLGHGDLTLHSRDRCADSSMLFPLGYCSGLSIGIDFDRFSLAIPPLLLEAALDAGSLRRKYANQLVTIPACSSLDRIFTPLCEAPEKLRSVYLQLKLQELLLFLADYAPLENSHPQFPAQQTELVREIHDELLRHLDQRITIDMLTSRYPINSTTLKRVFKAVYGQPIASYMKSVRMRTAATLLRESDDSIADIAAQVGYTTQSKFTQAFKAATGILPKDLRKQKHS